MRWSTTVLLVRSSQWEAPLSLVRERYWPSCTYNSRIPRITTEGSSRPFILAFSFLIGLQVCQIPMTPLGGGVDTIFVASAWDPEVLMRDHPDF